MRTMNEAVVWLEDQKSVVWFVVVDDEKEKMFQSTCNPESGKR